MGQMVAALVVRDETLAAACHPPQRPLQAPRSPSQHGLLRIMLALVTEAAADVRSNDAQSLLGHAELFGDQTAYVVRNLGGAVKQQALVCRDRHHSTRFDGRADETIVDE